MLTRHDRTLVPLDVPSNVLQYCIDVLEDDSSMRLADGIKRKLNHVHAQLEGQLSGDLARNNSLPVTFVCYKLSSTIMMEGTRRHLFPEA